LSQKRAPKYVVPKKPPTKKPVSPPKMARKEHFVADFGQRGATEYEIEREVDDLFSQTPIPFKFENPSPPQVKT
jgi:hypothetical protein